MSPSTKTTKKPVKKKAKAKAKAPKKKTAGNQAKEKKELKKRLLERRPKPAMMDVLAVDARSVFTLENLKKAYCKSLACTGIGAANTSCDNLLDQQVGHIIPEPMQVDFPKRLLACVTLICSNEPHSWQVDQIEPVVTKSSTFRDLLDNWFLEVVWPR